MMRNSAAGDGSSLTWFKSSYSTNEGPACVEVALTPESIHVRDSKHPQGPQLAFRPHHWTAFLTHTPTD